MSAKKPVNEKQNRKGKRSQHKPKGKHNVLRCTDSLSFCITCQVLTYPSGCKNVGVYILHVDMMCLYTLTAYKDMHRYLFRVQIICFTKDPIYW
jgi:hypothetical protein